MSYSGEYPIVIDDKKRASLPADIRRQLSPNAECCVFFIKLGLNGKPWIYSEADWAALTKDTKARMEAGRDELDRKRFHFGMTFKVESDRQGRSVLPERIIAKTKTGKDAVLVGVDDHLEIWNAGDWDKYMDDLLAQFSEEGKSHQTQQPPGTV